VPTGDIGMKGAANYVVGGVLALRRLETAVTSCAGANGFGMTASRSHPTSAPAAETHLHGVKLSGGVGSAERLVSGADCPGPYGIPSLWRAEAIRLPR